MITLILLVAMGGNSSYSKEWGGVPTAKRTHTDSEFKIDGYKVVFLTKKNNQTKNILNSNSANAVYLIAKKHEDGTIEIESIDVFVGHQLNYEINLEFDSDGKILPYTKGKGSHAHFWKENPDDGKLKRNSHDKKNTFPIAPKYNSLISKIETFNKQKNKKL